MSSLRFALLLLILGGLVLFVLQNWTPVLPLVILGTPSQPLPLAFWMITAIAAGALTIIVIAGLFRITAFTAAPRKRSSRRSRSNVPPSPSNEPTGWNTASSDSADTPTDTYSAYTRVQSGDDWEHSAGEGWDDWEAPETAARPTDVRRVNPSRRREEYAPSAQPEPFDRTYADESPGFDRSEPEEPPIYDAPYEVYRPAYSESFDRVYTEPEYSPPDYTQPSYAPDYSAPDYSEPIDSEPAYAEPEQEVWDNWEEEENREDDRPTAPPEPQRPIVEVQQEPKTQYRSGTVYSYSYRDDDVPQSKADSSTSEASSTSEVQSERVIISPSTTDANTEDDWGFDEDEEDDTDDSRRDSQERTRRDRAHSDDDW